MKESGKIMNEVRIFKNEELGLEVRCMMINGKEYFVAKDIAEALGYSDPSSSVSKHCKNKVKQVIEAGCQNGKVVKTETTFINEGDMYRLIVRSKLESAQRFEEWVMDEVLPAIRKDGGYIKENATEEQVQTIINKWAFKTITRIISECSVMELEEKINQMYQDNLNMKKRDRDKFHRNMSKTEYKQHLRNHIRKAILNRPMPNGIDSAVESVVRYKIIDLLDRDLMTTTKKSTSNKIAYKDRVIFGLKDKLENEIPNEDKYIELDYHAISNNSLYDGNKRTWTYNKWIKEFPSCQVPPSEYWKEVDFNKPVKLYLKFKVVSDRYDVNNLCKAIIDQIFNREMKIDDNIVKKTICELDGICESFDEAKIYYYIQNIDPKEI